MRRREGFTLVELAVVVALVGVLLVIAVTGMDDWEDAEAARVSARSVAGAFSYARSEAIRTGNNHMVFFEEDMAGNPLSDDGVTVPILVLDDGLPGSTDQNCDIDAGETVRGFRLERGVGFGASAPGSKAPADEGTGTYTTGWTFTDGGGNDAKWVLIRPDGTPRAVDNTCAMAALGSGGGGVYLGNAERELAVVLTPLGASRVYTWQEGASSWD